MFKSNILLVALAVCLSLCTALGVVPVAAQGVLVFGGTGQLGAYHVRLLVERGEDVAVFVRPTSDRSRLKGLNVTYVTGDLLDRESVMDALAQTTPRVAFDTTANNAGNDGDFYDDAAANILAAAKQSGVDHLILHSSVGVRESAQYFPQYGNLMELPNIQAKARAEEYYEASGLTYTIIRHGSLPVEPAAATGRGRLTDRRDVLGRITRADLSRLAVDCMEQPRCTGKIFHAIDDDLPMPTATRRPTRNR